MAKIQKTQKSNIEPVKNKIHYLGNMNFVQVETKTGIKEFELYHGDITSLDFNINLLTVSAFKDDYTPTPNSVIGQLFLKGIDVKQLSLSPFLEFKNSLGTWVSTKLINQKFDHLICLEIVGSNTSFEVAVKNLFSTISTLEIQGLKNESVAIPLWATGDQGFGIEMVAPVIIESSLEFLQYSRYLRKIYFVIRNESKAANFNKYMNLLLGRSRINTPTGDLANMIKSELLKNLDHLVNTEENVQIFRDFKRLLQSNFEPFDFGAIARKTIEYVINQIVPDTKSQFELMKKIESLSTKNVAQWMQSYLHLIRIFGNEAVHHKEKTERIPQHIEAKDLEIGMYCMNRILEFYINKSSFNNERLNHHI